MMSGWLLLVHPSLERGLRLFAQQHIDQRASLLCVENRALLQELRNHALLLLCLQLKQVALGATLVLCFSIGLAVTMVTVGVVAALGVRHAERRFAGAFSAFARRAPYASGALIILVGLALAAQAARAILS